MTNAGGEVVALDSGGYGPFTVSKAASITSPSGVYAGVAVSSGAGVMVNGSSTDVVRLSGLTIVGTAGTHGVEMVQGADLTIDHCAIGGGLYGVVMNAPRKISIVHSSIYGAIEGVFASATTSTANVMLDDCTLTGNSYGVVAAAGSLVTLTNSLVEGSVAAGAISTSNNTVDSYLVVEHCGFAHNVNGVWGEDSVSGGHGNVYIAFSTITGSTNGLRQVGTSVVLSRGNNTIIGNTNETVGTIGSFTGQ